MDLQTEQSIGRPGENFLVARYSKDLLRRSKVGGLVVNKEGIDSASFNRTIAADALFAPTRSFSRSLVHREDVDAWRLRRPDGVPRPGAVPEHEVADLRASSPTSTTTSTTRSGSFRAGASGRRKVHLERNPRPGGLIRVMEPMINLDLHDGSEQPAADAARPPHARHAVPERRLPERLVQQLVRSARQPFAIQSDVTIPVGRLPVRRVACSCSTATPSRRVLRAVHVLAADVLRRHAHGHRRDARRARQRAARPPSSRCSATTSTCRGARSS